VLVHSAAEEAIFTTMSGLLGRGDHVIVHQPCYQSLSEVARHVGCVVTPWRARAEDGWAPDLDELRTLIRPDTRMIVVNFPHNPTGNLPERRELEEIVALVEEREILLFSDEMYRFLEHEPEARLPAACDLSDRAISLGGLSKSFGLPGVRLGWIASRRAQVLDEVSVFKDYTTICASAPSELLARVAVRQRDALIGRNRELIARHLPVLAGFFGEHEEVFDWVPPRAGPVTFPRLKAGDGDGFSERLYQRSGVLLLPGSVFGEPDHVRMGFGRRDFGDGLARLAEEIQRTRR
jgi:aspartate/methionine/tyrosine aminotransferase